MNKSNDGLCRVVNARLESLYICISLDYLMILQDFFVSGLSPSEPNRELTTATMALEKKPSIAPGKAPAVKRTSLDVLIPADRLCFVSATVAPVDNDVETHIEIIVKNPQVILLEDQRNSNSNCLVLDVSLFSLLGSPGTTFLVFQLALQMKMISVGSETKLYGWLNDLTVYSSSLGALKDAENSLSKVKYRVSALLLTFLCISSSRW